jgi:tripartite-type tricarboxylate transporter receptor subunit TctC
VPLYSQPRTVWLPGGVTPDQVAFYVDLMKKVEAQPEWKEYIERTSQTSIFLTGDEFQKFMAQDLEQNKKVAVEEGWLVSQ